MTTVMIEKTLVCWDYGRGILASSLTLPLDVLPPEGVLVGASQGRGTVTLHYYLTTWDSKRVEKYPLIELPTAVREHLQLRYEYFEDNADPAGLMPDDRFTIRNLRLIHEVLRGRTLPKDTFRRDILPFVVGTGTFAGRTATGRPAELFTLAVREE